MQRKAGAEGVKSSVKKNVRLAVLKRDGWRCMYCGQGGLSGTTATVDHVIPACFGGDHSAENLRTACKRCNCQKQDRSVEWFRMFLAHSRTPLGSIITLEQYHQLLGKGIALPPLPVQRFWYEEAQ